MAVRPDLHRFTGVFAVPTELADEYLTRVSGEELKVLIWLFRYPEQGRDLPALAKALSLSETELSGILSYWVGEGFLQSDEEIPEQIKTQSVTGEQIARKLDEHRVLRELVDLAEQCYGRPLSTAEQQSVVAMYQNRRLPVDVILMLISYCVTEGKTGARYLDSVARAWSDEGIDTLEKAEERLHRMQEQKQVTGQIRSAFGLGSRKLSKKETDYIRVWTEEYGYDMKMILAAYERTVDAIASCSFPYINTILSSWHDKNFKTPEDITDEAKPANGRIRREPSYQTEKLDRLGLQVPPIKSTGE